MFEQKRILLKNAEKIQSIGNISYIMQKIFWNDIPLKDIYKEGLSFSEKIVTIDKLQNKTSYIMFPENSLRTTKDGRIALNTEEAKDLSFLMTMLMLNDNLKTSIGMERMVTFDGWEIFKSVRHQVELIETQSIASDFRDVKTAWRWIEGTHPYWYSDSGQDTNELITYKISKPLSAILYYSGTHIAELTYPTTTSQHRILRRYDASTIDPPKINVIFPKVIKIA